MTAWLVRLAARRWPVELRDELREEWLAELHALRAEPHGDWLALRFGVSLAVRRPAASLVPAIPTLREHRTLYPWWVFASVGPTAGTLLRGWWPW